MGQAENDVRRQAGLRFAAADAPPSAAGVGAWPAAKQRAPPVRPLSTLEASKEQARRKLCAKLTDRGEGDGYFGMVRLEDMTVDYAVTYQSLDGRQHGFPYLNLEPRQPLVTFPHQQDDGRKAAGRTRATREREQDQTERRERARDREHQPGNKHCFVCNCSFSDYAVHINTEDHKRRMREDPLVPDIDETLRQVSRANGLYLPVSGFETACLANSGPWTLEVAGAPVPEPVNTDARDGDAARLPNGSGPAAEVDTDAFRGSVDRNATGKAAPAPARFPVQQAPRELTTPVESDGLPAVLGLSHPAPWAPGDALEGLPDVPAERLAAAVERRRLLRIELDKLDDVIRQVVEQGPQFVTRVKQAAYKNADAEAGEITGPAAQEPPVARGVEVDALPEPAAGAGEPVPTISPVDDARPPERTGSKGIVVVDKRVDVENDDDALPKPSQNGERVHDPIADAPLDVPSQHAEAHEHDRGAPASQGVGAPVEDDAQERRVSANHEEATAPVPGAAESHVNWSHVHRLRSALQAAGFPEGHLPPVVELASRSDSVHCQEALGLIQLLGGEQCARLFASSLPSAMHAVKAPADGGACVDAGATAVPAVEGDQPGGDPTASHQAAEPTAMDNLLSPPQLKRSTVNADESSPEAREVEMRNEVVAPLKEYLRLGGYNGVVPPIAELKRTKTDWGSAAAELIKLCGGPAFAAKMLNWTKLKPPPVPTDGVAEGERIAPSAAHGKSGPSSAAPRPSSERRKSMATPRVRGAAGGVEADDGNPIIRELRAELRAGGYEGELPPSDELRSRKDDCKHCVAALFLIRQLGGFDQAAWSIGWKRRYSTPTDPTAPGSGPATSVAGSKRAREYATASTGQARHRQPKADVKPTAARVPDADMGAKEQRQEGTPGLRSQWRSPGGKESDSAFLGRSLTEALHRAGYDNCFPQWRKLYARRKEPAVAAVLQTIELLGGSMYARCYLVGAGWKMEEASENHLAAARVEVASTSATEDETPELARVAKKRRRPAHAQANADPFGSPDGVVQAGRSRPSKHAAKDAPAADTRPAKRRASPQSPGGAEVTPAPGTRSQQRKHDRGAARSTVRRQVVA